MSILPTVIRQFKARRLNQIENFRKFPVETQEKLLFDLLKSAESTRIGKQYNFSSFKTVSDFQSGIPVRTYEEYLPFIEQLIHGEKDLTWPGETRWFAKSSGTTSAKSKFIPVSKESLWKCHYQAAKDILAIYAVNYPDTRIFSGKGLTLGGSNKINQLNQKSIYGDLSALLIWNAPFYAELIRTPKQKIALIEDFEEKLEMIAKTTVGQNVTSISGVPSWNLTLIKHILSFTGKSNLLEVWPNLEVFFHGGVSFTPYREIYRKLIPGDQMHYMETYNASEGFFGIQDIPSSDDMLLMLDYGIFYEFIPMDELAGDSSRALTLREVRTGVNYAMVITTNGGLWRYRIGDTVVFTSTFPFRFRISGRTKHYINAFGEEVIMENADQALQTACAETGAVISEYTAGPVYMDENSRGSHEWLIEFEKNPGDLDKFIDVLDYTLKTINSDYEAKRHKDINLVRPIVKAVPGGTFHRWLKSKNRFGGQSKVPRLSNNREFIEELYDFL